MQIVDLCIDLPAASLLPSILSSTSLLSWRYHPSSYSYQFISPHSSFHIFPHLHSPSVILPCQNDHLSRVYMCVCVCISVLVQGNISVWPVVRAKDCLYYRLLLGDRETTNSESEWVYVCLIALTCVFVLACLGLFLCELGSVLVWESLSVSLSFSEANLLSEGHHSSEEQ